jgi:hypothetical protein
MDVMVIQKDNGTIEAVPLLRFKIGYYDRETYFVIGGDTTGSCPEQPAPGFIVQRLGLMSELHDRVRSEINEFMDRHFWPADKYPDPDVILVTAPIVVFNNN